MKQSPSQSAIPWYSGGVFSLLVLFSWPVLRQLVAVYESVPDYSHGYLVPLISGWVIYREWGERPPADPTPFGLILLLPGLLLVVLGIWYDTAMRPGGLGSECLGGFGCWLALLGLTALLFGKARLRFWAFPLVYLLFAIPLPDSLTLMITLPMREAVSSIATTLLQAGGVDVVREGHVLRLPNALLGVEDACSGIRSLWALLASSIAIAYLMQCRWHLVVLLGVCAFPLSFLQNILRVLITTWLVNRHGMAYAEGWRHSLTGGITFALAAALVVVLAVWLSLKQGLREAAPPASDKTGSHRPLLVGVSVILLLVGLFAVQFIRGHYRPLAPLIEAHEASRRPLDQLPERIGAFSRLGFIELHPSHLEILQPSDAVAAEYASPGGERVYLMMFYWPPQRVGAYQSAARPHSPDVCFPAVGFQPIATTTRTLALFDRGPEVQIRRFKKDEARKVVVYWQNTSAMTDQENFPGRLRQRWQVLRDSWSQADLMLGRQFSVTIGVDVDLDGAAAEELALAFAAELQPLLPPYGLTDQSEDAAEGVP